MSRIALLLAAFASGCHAPALANFASGPDHWTTSDTSTTGTSSTTTPGIETSTFGSTGSGEVGSDSEGTGSTSTTDTSTTSTGSSGEPGTSTGAPTLCGDGVVAADEECDDGNDDPDDGCASCFRDRWVFATSTLQSPDLIGGLGGADSLCRQLAQKAALGPNWTSYQAWLSDSQESAGERLFPGMGRYRRLDGAVIAENFEQFLSGTLSAPFDVDEFGQPAPGGAWTGTLPDGTAAPGTTHCEDWTIDTYTEFEGYYGNGGTVDGNWTFADNPAVNPTGCDANLRLYCLEGA